MADGDPTGVARLERLRAEQRARRAADWAFVQAEAPELAGLLTACRAAFGREQVRVRRLTVLGRRIV